MPRRSVLSAAERGSLMAVLETTDELIRHYMFNEADLSFINQHRGSANRLGLAVQLCYLRFPGIILGVDETPFPALLKLVAEAFVEMLRQQRIILPAIDFIERVCSEALTLGTRRVYEVLTAALSDHHRGALDGLLEIREGTKGSGLIWLRQPPGPPKPKHILAHLERLKIIRELSLPGGLEHAVHQNRLRALPGIAGGCTARTTDAYYFFRFVSRPQKGRKSEIGGCLQ